MSVFSFLKENAGKNSSFAQGIAQAQNTKGAILLDVRTPQEYAGGHIAGSVNVPLDKIAQISAKKDAPLFVYCLSGARSGQACAYLQGLGYHATNIGGISGYHGPLE
ncbi:MAG: rhodanese-like domain-containing protein [Ruthenibacterium sp.]